MVHGGHVQHVFLGAAWAGQRQAVVEEFDPQHIALIEGVEARTTDRNLVGARAAGGLGEYSRLQRQHVLGIRRPALLDFAVVDHRGFAGHLGQLLLGLLRFGGFGTGDHHRGQGRVGLGRKSRAVYHHQQHAKAGRRSQ